MRLLSDVNRNVSFPERGVQVAGSCRDLYACRLQFISTKKQALGAAVRGQFEYFHWYSSVERINETWQ